MSTNKPIRLGVRSKERNQEARKTALLENDGILPFRRMMKKKLGYDMFSEEASEVALVKKNLPMFERGFSWKKVQQKLIEADSASTFPQLIRAGVQLSVNSAYQTVEITHDDWTTTIPSSKETELYAPLHGVGFPSEVGRQETYPEQGIAGLDISLTNKKFGEIFAFEWELGEDDQTSQVEQQSALLAEYMAQAIEVYCYGKLASVANMAYANLSVPKTETKDPQETTSSYPYAPASAPFLGGGYNRPASFGTLTQANVQTAKTTLINQLNKLGLKMSVNGKRLIVGPTNEFNASILLNSAFYPSTVSGSAGAVGGSFAINPIKGIADLTVSRFVFKNDGTCDGSSSAWYLMDDSKPFFVVQLREPVSVIQESPDAGESFNRDVIRFKARSRFNCDFIDPRFVFQGDDGSV